jgi:hypothetical protein
MLTRAAVALLILTSGGLSQDQAAVSGPVLGYALQDGSLRALFGIPGAVTWGPAILSELEAAAVSPARDVAIVCAGGQAFLAPLTRPDERSHLFDGACTRIVFSHQGRAAVVHDGSGQRLVVVAGLPAAPEIAREIEWTGEVSALALSDDAQKLVVAAAEDTFQVTPDGARLIIPGVGAASAAVMSGHTAWISAHDAAVVFEVDLGGEAASIRGSIAIPPSAALALSRDAAMLLALDRETLRPILWHIARGETIALQGACEAGSAGALDGNAVFQLITRGGRSCILDADRDSPRFFLLPGAPQ